MFENLQIPSQLIPADPRFGCGPSQIPVESLHALAETGQHLLGTSHRRPAVKNLVGEVITGLKQYFKVPEDYTVVLGNGGASLLFDMVGLGLVNQASAHFTCGEFSEKWFKAHKKIPWIKAQQTHAEYGLGITPKGVDGVDMVCCTLNETSTGVQIDQLPEKSPKYLVAVDATSGAGQVPCDVSKTDIFFFSPQKVFGSEGGLWIAILSPAAKERALKIAEDKSRYIPVIMSWKSAIENSVQNQTLNTPSIATIFLLNEQLKRMNKFGYDAVIKEAARKAKLLYTWAESKPYLSPYIKEEKYRSTSVATIDVDEKIPVENLLKGLRSKKIVYDIEAYRNLGRNQFRIALFHSVSYSDLEKLTQLLSHCIETEKK